VLFSLITALGVYACLPERIVGDPNLRPGAYRYWEVGL
jgi:hypothetical protein